MSAALVAVLLSLLSAVAYAAAAVVQERLAARRPASGVLRLLTAPAWWGSVLLNASAALLHVVALAYGPLTVVQPLGALTLVAAVPLGARAAGRPVTAVEWRGTALTLAGLAALLVPASGPAPDDPLSVPEALAVAGATAVLIGLLTRVGPSRGLRHGAASGIASGVASALTQTVTVAATDRAQPVLSLQVAGVAVLVAAFAAGGLLLAQSAYRDGLGAPLAMVTLANPVAAAAIGMSLLGEQLRGGPAGVALALTGAVLSARGVILLSRPADAVTGATGTETPGTETPVAGTVIAEATVAGTACAGAAETADAGQPAVAGRAAQSGVRTPAPAVPASSAPADLPVLPRVIVPRPAADGAVVPRDPSSLTYVPLPPGRTCEEILARRAVADTPTAPAARLIPLTPVPSSTSSPESCRMCLSLPGDAPHACEPLYLPLIMG